MTRFFNRLIPWLVSLIIFIVLEQILKTPRQIHWLAAGGLVVIILSIWQLSGRNFVSKKFWQLLTTPIFLFSGGILFLSFLEDPLLRQVFLIGVVALIGVFLEVLFLRFYFRPKYQPHSLENISSHIDVITVFLVSSSFFSLIIFLGLPIWIFGLLFFIIIGLLSYQLIWTGHSPMSDAWPYISVITIITTEIFFVVSFLPTSAYVNGLVATIFYYLMTGLARNWLLGVKEPSIIKRYLFISLGSLVLVLISAKWF